VDIGQSGDVIFLCVVDAVYAFSNMEFSELLSGSRLA